MSDSSTRTAEYYDADVVVTSNEPLTGTIELIGGDDEPIDLRLDRETAELLISALVEFLANGEGDDSPNMTVHSQQ